MNCEYCKKEFSNISSLNSHKKKTKYCLKIQDSLGINNKNYISECNIIEENKKFKCYVCLKTISNKTNLIYHLQKICMKDVFKINESIEKLIKEKDDIIQTFEFNIIKHQDILKEKEDVIEKLKIENDNMTKQNYGLLQVNEILKTDHECVHEIAKQPKNINNMMNKTLNLITPLNLTDKEQIRSVIDNNYDLNYIFSGQKGCAKFAVENIIKDDNGRLKYICADPSRQVFKYKDEFGNIQKDIDAKKLTTFLVEGGLRNKVYTMASEWWTDKHGETNADKFEMLINKTESIRNLEEDNTEFKKELIAMTSI